MDVTAAISNVKQELLPRRLNFVEAKYDWKMPFSETITFAKSTESYSVCYGGHQKATIQMKPSIYDRKKLAQIKSWAKRFNIGAGLEDKINRGFALSVLYVLRSVPVFRQFAMFHKESCHRVGCTLCKIYRFFEDTEQMNSTVFPLDLNVFNRQYKVGATGDSCEFFSSLVNVLQSEEIGSSRSFGSISEFTSAIGQMFRIQVTNRIVCRKCGRTRTAQDGYWTLVACQGVEKAVDEKAQWDVKDGVCDACGEEVYIIDEFSEDMPIVLTVQMNWWNGSGQFRKRRFDFERLAAIRVKSVPYKLCGFTAYDGGSSEGGKFAAVFLSSAGTWNIHFNGQIESIPVSQLGKYNPQLLFYTRDEPNDVAEQSQIVKIAEDDSTESENEEERKIEKVKEDAAVESLKATIQRQLNKHRREVEPQNVVVVDARAGKKQRVEKPKPVAREVSNPMAMLMKSKRVHEVSTWDGVEVDPQRAELTKPWQEQGFDEWDKELDKGHVRKLKKKRPAPVENPFDKASTKQSKNIFTSRRDKKRKAAHH